MAWLEESGWVYLIGERKDGPVKIGWTTNVVTRLRNIRIACPLELGLLCAFRGTIRDERKLHGYADGLGLRIRGEWFRREEPLPRLINILKSDRLVGFSEPELRFTLDRERWGGVQPQRRKKWVYDPSPEVRERLGLPPRYTGAQE